MESIEKKQASRHGGYRPGAGRKSKYGVKTVVMRIPENRVQEVQNMIGGGLESVTESKLLTDFMALCKRWEGRIKPHQNPDGKVTQLRWPKCWEIWQELAQVIQQSH
jgi:hypothetical protein